MIIPGGVCFVAPKLEQNRSNRDISARKLGAADAHFESILHIF
jgi:hypothetical protein